MYRFVLMPGLVDGDGCGGGGGSIIRFFYDFGDGWCLCRWSSNAVCLGLLERENEIEPEIRSEECGPFGFDRRSKFQF